MYSLFKPLVFKMDPESAHNRIVVLLQVAQGAPGGLAVLETLFKEPHIPTTLAGMTLRNPVGLAAGFDKNAEMIPALAALGFGFLEVGTLTRRPQPGNPKPRIFRYPALQGLVNRLGFNNVGVDEALRTLEKLPRQPIPIGINVGKNATTSLEDAPAEYAECLKLLYAHGDYFTLNISSPNTADLRKLHEPERLKQLFDAVLSVVTAQAVRKPVFLKVSPDAELSDLETVAEMAARHGLGLMATNTTVDRTGLDGLEKGGLSGAPVRARSTEVVRHLAKVTGGKVPLVGVGGIFTSEHAKEKLDAGAHAVQVYTGLIYQGPGVVSQIVRGLAKPT